ncbi:MAG TPA: VWA domain-containing protein [Acidimicrobiales bacterium]|nr:VWA domain-containing protein [Acidimicrobiales bacterium]
MSFREPSRLLLLLLVAAVAAAYVGVQVHRRRLARRFASPAMLPSLVPQRIGWWRHALAALFVAGLVAASLGAAQPTVDGEREREHATIVVAIDTSDSMLATDVAPDRLTAAKRAASAFIDDLPASFDVALVTAGASPTVVAGPTADRTAVTAALDALGTGPGTALGEAILTGLSVIPSAADDTVPAARIVLLSDGVTTTGRPDALAVEAAAEAGVAVSTIAFGTADASVVSQGVTVEVPVDATALRAIAEGTGGRFFEAATPAELSSIYAEIDADIRVEPTDVDVAEWFAGAALAVVVTAMLVSVLATGRPATA